MILRIVFSNMQMVTFQCIVDKIVFIEYFGMPIAYVLLAVSGPCLVLDSYFGETPIAATFHIRTFALCISTNLYRTN